MNFSGATTSNPPHFLEFREFSIQDKPLLDPYFRSDGNRLCEYSFAAQFCWQAYNRSVWAIIDDMLVIRFEVGGHYRFTCPVGDGDRRRAIEHVLGWQAAAGSPPAIDFVPDMRGCHGLPSGLVALPDPNNYDYVYLRSELADLPGRKFAQKRNHISALTRDHRWQVLSVPDPRARQAELLDYVEKWSTVRINGNPTVINEFELDAARRAIRYADPLGLNVFVLTIDDQVEGISIAERTHADMVTVHFEKASIDIRGAYQAICSGVASLMPGDVVYMNREQDMGVEGLRKTKNSWNPAEIEKCWVIRQIPRSTPVPNTDQEASPC